MFAPPPLPVGHANKALRIEKLTRPRLALPCLLAFGSRGGLQGADMKMFTPPSTVTATATSTLPLAVSSTAAAAVAASTAGGTPSRSRPDPSAVEIESVAAGVDPADTLTIVSHAGCSTEVAIAALRRADGDVVDAAMSLTAV